MSGDVANLFTPLTLPLRLLEDIGRIAEAVAELPTLVRTIVELGERVEDIQAAVHSLQDDLSSLPRSIKTLGGDLRGVRGTIEDLPGAIAQMRDDLNTLPPGIEGMGGDLKGLRDQLGGLPDRVGAMHVDLSEVRRQVAPMDDDLSTVETAIRELVPTIRRVEEAIDNMRSDLAGLPFVGKR